MDFYSIRAIVTFLTSSQTLKKQLSFTESKCGTKMSFEVRIEVLRYVRNPTSRIMTSLRETGLNKYNVCKDNRKFKVTRCPKE